MRYFDDWNDPFNCEQYFQDCFWEDLDEAENELEEERTKIDYIIRPLLWMLWIVDKRLEEITDSINRMLPLLPESKAEEKNSPTVCNLDHQQ